MQEQVRAFHEKFGAVVSERVRMSREDLRRKLIMEEASETASALRESNLIETVDGLCDLLYVTFGTAVEMGVDLEPCFDEVHRSNMAKEGGGERADGKILKPEGWQPPDIRGELRKQGAEEEELSGTTRASAGNIATRVDRSARLRCARDCFTLGELRQLKAIVEESAYCAPDWLKALIADVPDGPITEHVGENL